MNWPEHPFISERVARRIFGARNIAKHVRGDDNSLWPSQHFTVTAPHGNTVKLTVSSQMEEDDGDEDAQYDYRKAKVSAVFQPNKPYSRYHAARLAQQLRRAASQARNDLANGLSWVEHSTTYPTFFEGTVVEAEQTSTFMPQRYRLWGPFAEHPPRHQLAEPK